MTKDTALKLLDLALAMQSQIRVLKGVIIENDALRVTLGGPRSRVFVFDLARAFLRP
jgi:hypothetical protein